MDKKRLQKLAGITEMANAFGEDNYDGREPVVSGVESEEEKIRSAINILTGFENEESTTDCRSKIGVTVGLIDGLIAMGRVLRRSDLESYEVQSALRDLQDDEDIKYLLDLETNQGTQDETEDLS